MDLEQTMELLKIVGAVFLCFFIYGVLKEIGIFELLKTILEIVFCVFLFALALAFVISLFGVQFETALAISLPICILYVVVKFFKK